MKRVKGGGSHDHVASWRAEEGGLGGDVERKSERGKEEKKSNERAGT
jgi:hypothetical protein